MHKPTIGSQSKFPHECHSLGSSETELSTVILHHVLFNLVSGPDSSIQQYGVESTE